MRLRGLALLSALVVAAGATPTAAAARGVIKGRVLNGSTGEPQPRAEVVLKSAREDGSGTFVRSAVTGHDGRYAFTRLPTGDDRFYTLDARYDGGTFAGGAVSLPDDTKQRPVITTTLRVWKTTSDPNVILVESDRTFFILNDTRVGAIATAAVLNNSRLAYVGRGAAPNARPDGRAPTLGLPLPSGACERGVAILDADIDIPEIQCTDFGFATTVAIPPGKTNVTYSYEVEGTGGTFDLTRPALYPTIEMSVFASPPLTVETDRLSPDGSVTLQNKRYNRWSTEEALDPGDPVQLLGVADAGLAPLKVAAASVPAVLVLFSALWFVVRRRATRRRPPEESDGDDLLGAIAELDLRYRAGEVPHDEWATRRAGLKAELQERRSLGTD